MEIALLAIGVTLHVQNMFVVAGEDVPVDIVITNEGKKSVPFMDFPSDDCFAHFYVKFQLEGVQTHTPGCSIRDWPGRKQKLKRGQEIKRTINLRAFFPNGKLAPGTYPIKELGVDTTPLRDHFDGEYAFPVGQQSRSSHDLYVVDSARTFRIKRGEAVELAGNETFEFQAHGHKRTYPGQRSPLIIHTSIGETRCEPPDEMQFFLKQHAFELLSYEYDGFMELRYFGKIGPAR